MCMTGEEGKMEDWELEHLKTERKRLMVDLVIAFSQTIGARTDVKARGSENLAILSVSAARKAMELIEADVDRTFTDR